jgi:hypothetical protein
MKKGRPSKYHLNKNLKLIKKNRRSRPMANCNVCGTKNIVSCDWADHHPDNHNIMSLNTVEISTFIKDLID